MPRPDPPAPAEPATDELPVVGPAADARYLPEPGRGTAAAPPDGSPDRAAGRVPDREQGTRTGRARAAGRRGAAAERAGAARGRDADAGQVGGTGGRAARRRAADGAVAAAGHGHGHGHGPAAPAGRRVRLLIAALLVPCGLAALVGVVLLWPGAGPAPVTAQVPVRGEVTGAQAADCTPGSGEGGCAALEILMADGPLPGRALVQLVPVEPSTPTFGVGDDIVLAYSGGDPSDPGSYQVVDFQRSGALAWLAVLFAGAVLLLARLRGLLALGALVLSFVVLLGFVLPAILDGRDPLAVAVTGSGLIMFAVLYLTHGFSARTSTAVLGTLVSLALIGVLGTAFSAAARLTGIDDQTATLIASLDTGVDARGLLLAGVVIGALGVLDDVTVTQTSAVWELHRADPSMSTAGLFAAAMRIGRDHVASAVNTLVLAYAGASLPLMLLFSLSGQGLGDVLTTQSVATEVVRTLVGSIGLVASVPITTALAAVVATRESPA